MACMVIKWYSAPRTGLSTCRWCSEGREECQQIVSNGQQWQHDHQPCCTSHTKPAFAQARLEEVEGGAAQGRVVPPPAAPPRMPHQAAEVTAGCRQQERQEQRAGS